jgi:hypothetical protein
MTRRTVEDSDGTRYLLLKRSEEASLVRDPETGERHHLPNAELSVVEDVTTTETALAGIPDEVVALLTAVHDERALALLVELDEEGPMSVRQLLSAYDFCESDLHGMMAELRAGGLVAETRVAGERGYEVTPRTSEALAALA